LWPEWLQSVLPRPEHYEHYKNAHHTGRATWRKSEVSAGEASYPIGRKIRPGHMWTRKVREVCRSCNNGWKSRLQEAAKPRLVPLITGGWREISPGDQKILAAWAVMFTMVLELAHDETNTHTLEQRREFSLKLAPPKNW